MAISGIYKITNINNGKAYIGQSIDIMTRWRTHKNELNRGCHHNNHLQYAWNKFSADSFDFSIIEECSVEDLDDREKFWINKFNTFGDNGYNLTDGGREGQHVDTLEVMCLNTKEIFTSTREAAEKYNVSISGISSCLNRRIKYCGRINNERLVWRYVKEYVLLSDEEIKNLILDAYKPIDNNRSHSVICLNTMNVYDSLVSAEKDTGIKATHICSCCTGRTMCTEEINGVRSLWMYYDDYLSKGYTNEDIESIIASADNKYKIGGHVSAVILLNTGEIFNSMIEASDAYGIKPQNISSSCRNKTRCGGKDSNGTPLVWMYLDEYNELSEEKRRQRFDSAFDDSYLHINDISVVLLNTKEEFKSISDATKKYNTTVTCIVSCCKQKHSYAGTDKNGQALVWMYKADYDIASEEEIEQRFINVQKSNNRRYEHSYKKVVLLNTLETFDKIKDASNKYNVHSTSISDCCSGKMGYAGIDDILGRLVWKYLIDYNQMSHEDIQRALLMADPKERKSYEVKCRKIICLNTRETFMSIKEAAKYYHINPPNISRALLNNNYSAGKHPITKEKLHWAYYNEN